MGVCQNFKLLALFIVTVLISCSLVQDLKLFNDLQRVTERRNRVVITDRMWARLLSSTNQPSFLSAKDIEETKKVEQQPTQLLDELKSLDDGCY